MSQTQLYNIALSLLQNIGDVLAKKLVSYCGSAENVFLEKQNALEKIPGIGNFYASAVINNRKQAIELAEKELKYIEKANITPIFYLDKEYPKRLLHCDDGPVMLYAKGNADFNAQKIVSIVGTREATEYGKELTDKLIADLKELNVTIVSGLAYGIDIQAHKAALANNLPTVCVLAHGLDRIYPSLHKSTAEKMLENGAWLTDFISGTIPNRENFPRRNRIVAGIADATIVIESKHEGGSLITAEIANSYSRDVFAFPGKISDVNSKGCNKLIKTNKAALVESSADIINMLGWENVPKTKQSIQKQLFIELTDEEKQLVDILKGNESIHADDLSFLSKMPISKISVLLLNLEFSGVVKSMPGKMYRLN